MILDGKFIEKGDEGKIVTYYDIISGDVQSGEISSWNDTYVFVRFSSNTCACVPSKLVWGNNVVEISRKIDVMSSLDMKDILEIDDFSIKIEPIDSIKEGINIHITGSNFSIKTPLLGWLDRDSDNAVFIVSFISKVIRDKYRRDFIINKLINNEN